MAPDDYQRRWLVEWGVAEITRASGRRYAIRFKALDEESVSRDLDHESIWPCPAGGGGYRLVSTS